MKLFGIDNMDLIAFMENATELFALKKYRSKELVQHYIGLVTQRSNFYGELEHNGNVRWLNKKITTFDSDTDITLVAEGPVTLRSVPVNNGDGEILYTGYGVIEVDGVVVYDGRTDGFMKGENNLTDVDNRQTSLNNLTDSANGDEGQIPVINATGDVVWGDAGVSTPGAIFVNPIDGDNATGDGTLNKPYKTPNYAISSAEVSFTINGTLTSGSNTVTSVSDEDIAKIERGNYAVEDSLPYETVIIANPAPNLLILSKDSTFSGNVDITIFQPVEVVVMTDCEITSSVWKEGVYPIFNGNVITANAINVFDVDDDIPQIPYRAEFKGHISLNNANAGFYSESNSLAENDINHVCNIKYKSAYSEGTGAFISIQRINENGCYNFDGAKTETLGILGFFEDLNSLKLNLQTSSALTKGIEFSRVNHTEVNGHVITPSSVDALYLRNINSYIQNGDVSGKILTAGGINSLIINGNVVADNVDLGSSHNNANIEFNSLFDVSDFKIASGTVSINGYFDGGCGLISGGVLNVNGPVRRAGSAYGNTFVNSMTGGVVNYNATLNDPTYFYGSLGIVRQSGGVWNWSNCSRAAVNQVLTGDAVVNVNGACLSPFFGLVDYGIIELKSSLCTVNHYASEFDNSKLGSFYEKTAGTLNLYGGSLNQTGDGKPPINCLADTYDSKNVKVFLVSSDIDIYTPYQASSFAPESDIMGLFVPNY